MAYIVIAYIIMADIVMADIVMACIVVAYIVMAYSGHHNFRCRIEIAKVAAMPENAT